MKSSLKQLGFVLCLLLSTRCAEAQATDTWTGGGGDGLWTNGSNWSALAPPATGAFVLVPITATITLPGTATSIDVLDLGYAPITLNATTAGFTTQFLAVYQTADAAISVPTGGTFTVSEENSFVGDSTYGSGTLTLSGTGTLAFTSNTGGLTVGGGATGVVNQTAGTATFTENLIIGADGDTFGTSGNGKGTYNLSGTGTLSAETIYVGVGSGGTEPASTGTLNITGGTLTAGDLSLGFAGGANDTATGVVNQTGGSVTVSSFLIVGSTVGGISNYNLSGTGTLNAPDSFYLGASQNATGTFTQSGGAATVNDMEVGFNGNGYVTLSGGTLTLTQELVLGEFTGAIGVVNQTGGTLTASGAADVYVGGPGGGTGSYFLSSGTITLGANGTLNIGTTGGTGTFTLSGSGDLIVPDGVSVGGSTGTGVFNYDGGTIDPTTTIDVESNGSFNQNADFAPPAGNPLFLGSGASFNLNSGTLTIGGDMTAAGFSGIYALSSANFNFAGGTVLPSGTDWYDALNGTVTGNSTIDTTNNNAILTGTLLGSGTLTIVGANTVDIDTGGLGNSSAGAWSVDVLGGTVDALASTFPSSGNITIGSSSTVDMNTIGTSTLTGAVTGAGAFNVDFGATTDTLELTAPVSLTGTTTFAGGGTLQVLNGSFGTSGQTGITGTGGLVVGAGSGTGAVSLLGTNNYTGATTIDSGYTLMASNFSTGVVTNRGTLGSNAALGNTLNIPTLTLGGSFVSTGTLLIRMNGLNADLIHVTGTANVSGSTFTLVNPGGTGTFTILTSTGLTANNIVQPASNYFFHATVAPATGNANDLDLITTTTTSSSIPGLTLTPNQSAVASALDSVLVNTSNLSQGQLQNFNTLLYDIGRAGSTAQLAQAYEQLTPQSLQYAQSIAYEHSSFLVGKVDGFDNALHHEFSGYDTSGLSFATPGFDSGLGRELQSLLAFDPPSFHQTAPNGVNYYPGGENSPAASESIESPSSPEPSSQVISDSPEPMPLRTEPHTMSIRKPDSAFSVFVGGDGTIANLNQSQGQPYAPTSKASYTSEDAIAGISYRMTSNLAAGILMDYSHTDANTDAYGSKTKVDSYSPGVFATFADKGFYVNGLFAYGRNDYTNQRAIPALGAIANSSPDGNQYTGALDAGYEFHPAQGWALTPAAGLTYTHLDIDSFDESGASPANLDVDAQHDDSLRSRLGGYVTYSVHPGQLTLLPTFSAMWQHEFLDQNAPITSQFSDFASGAFTVHSVSMGRDSALIGVGLTAELDNSMAIFINCMADLNGNYYAEDFVGGFKGSF